MRAGRWGSTTFILNDYFLLLLGLYFLVGVLPQALMLFTAVACHEGCHALVAARLGWQVKSVELFPFGGVARLYRPSGWRQQEEALIALAGPAASIFLAVIASLAVNLAGNPPAWLLFFSQVNLILALFNLWPGLPLDGGRIYRAWRARRAGLARATVEGAYGGQALAILLGAGSIIGFYLHLMDLQGLVLALFIFYIARQEGEMAPYMFWQDFWRRRGVRRQISPLKASKVFWLVADPGLPLSRVMRSFAPGSFNLVAIVGRQGGLEGIVTETEVLEELLSGGSATTLTSLLKGQKKN
ncbi:M50 family metallopeptidase [Moorella sp. Hama-1]|uniref:M50 family metallopeptidase n=1 Tax=Moorella sp. Hama-1 TaxID=2138101 RepID=UPI000D6479AA|nr:M50 family metallopeptidase [Moorella sp. Hama-1]MDN5361765.1 stage sporulation protein [Moorella sp. (in: firmicutes)]BCV20469.1 peptidase M50 [Moorella sp. Hama-1]